MSGLRCTSVSRHASFAQCLRLFSVLSSLVFSLVSTTCGPRYTSASRLASSAQCLRNIFSSVTSQVQFSQHNVWFWLHKCLAPRFTCASLPVESAVHFSHQRHVTKEPFLNSKKRCVLHTHVPRTNSFLSWTTVYKAALSASRTLPSVWHV